MSDTPSDAASTALMRLLRPRSLAVVGASSQPASAGGIVLGNIERFGYGGELHLVSRSRSEIDGRSCVPTIDDLPEDVDAVVLVVPAVAVREAVAACIRRKVGGAVVFASGFSEVGEAGIAAQREIADMARAGGLALLGPNCMGITNFVDRTPLTFEAVAAAYPPDRPGICAIAQSGAMGGNLRMALLGRGVPVAYAISTGNEAVLGAEDFLDGLIEDPEVGLFALFVEQLRDPARFLALAARAHAAGKPIVLLHPGRSARSREAAKSHTGALAGDHAVMCAFAARAGVVLVDSLDELFDTATILARYPRPSGHGVAVMTNSGALRGVALDFAEDIGLALPPLGADTTAKLRGLLPDFAAVDNPLDITAQAMVQPALFGATTEALLDDPAIGAALVTVMGGGPAQQMSKWHSLDPVLSTAEKPVALAYMGDVHPLSEDFMQAVKDSGVPFFRSPDRALRALGRVTTYGRWRTTEAVRAPAPTVAPLILPDRRGPIAEYNSKRLLASAGIRMPAGALAGDVAEAGRIAADIGYPVVLKAQADDLAHKSDAGGVAVGIADEGALAAAWDAMMRKVAAARPDLTLDGILVEAMAAPGGVEFIVGARRDPSWGAVLMVGLGGIWTEALADVQVVPADASVADIMQALGRLKGAAVLRGDRGLPARDTTALAEAVARIGAVLSATPGLSEIDVNPLLVYAAGEGVLALDALLIAG